MFIYHMIEILLVFLTVYSQYHTSDGNELGLYIIDSSPLMRVHVLSLMKTPLIIKVVK